MKATFENSVDVLLKAYLNDTLEHGNCYACAVGNLVANGLNRTLIKDWQEKRYKWQGTNFHCDYPSKQGWAKVFCTIGTPIYYTQYLRPDSYRGIAKEQIDSTGYTWRQLAKVEKAFESAKYGANEDDYMFNGLMAVIDVLAEIHGIDLTVRESAKVPFKAEFELK